MQFISVVFTIFAVIAAIALTVGIIKPTAFDKEGQQPNRLTKSPRLDNVLIWGFFLVLFGGLAIAAHPSGGKHPASKTVTTTQAAVKAPVTKPTAQPAPVATTQPTTAQQVHAWDVQYDYLITGLQSDFTKAQQDLQAQDTTAFANDCSKIASDAVTAEGKPAIPDATIETTWMQALGDEAAGGAACSDGITQNDTTELTQGATDFNNGSTAITKATQEIDALE
jgi:hypothetical protein